MNSTLFLLLFGLSLTFYLGWGIKILPREGWQFFAAMPLRKVEDGVWAGLNLTWYGLLTANAYAVAVALLFFLLGAIDIPFAGTALLATLLLVLCVPASRLVARLVEKKAHTFTVGGAVFVGILFAPGGVLLVNAILGPRLGFQLEIPATLAALIIAYAFGEGLGRLACISFGCCYGRRLSTSTPLLQRCFAGHCFVFMGKTRKIAYAGGQEGEKVLPVQALTAILYCSCGLFGMFLYLHAHFAPAFLLTLFVTQGWRVLSEQLRDDYRGSGRFSAYQVMGVTAIIYGGGTLLLATALPLPPPDISAGLATIWRPAPLLFLQSLWLVIFFYTGRSTVTGSRLSFHVHQDRI